MLFGRGNKVTDTFLAENTKESPVSFTISDEQLNEGYKMAEENGLEVIGVFHSHPGSEAFPSNVDKRFMQINPVAWVIYSGVNSDFRAFVLEDEITEIRISER